MRASPAKKIVVWNTPADGLAGVVEAGPLLFTSGVDGHRDPGSGAVVPEFAGDAETQCENAYGGIGRLLRQAGAELASVVRLDHLTSSQDWLPRRQTIRQRCFGRPAPLASTGIAARMEGINMLTASAIAVADPAQKEVLVPGPRYGMGNISSLVRGGPFLFLSGIRGTMDPRSGRAVAEESAEAFAAQTRLAYEIIGAILADAGAGADRLLRLDCYLRDIGRADEETGIRLDVLGPVPCVRTVVGLPLGARGEVEITALALAPGLEKPVVAAGGVGAEPSIIGAGGFLFVGECRPERPVCGDRAGQLEAALSVLETALARAGASLASAVRVEIFLRDVHFANAARSILRRRFGAQPPVVTVAGADLEDGLEAKLSAIACRAG